MKKFIFTCLFLAAIWNIVSAQITVSPEKPGPTDLITLTFDATQGNGGLADCDCTVYAHTGLITSKSSGPGDWRYVASDWGENLPSMKLEKTGDNQYQLEFNIKELYQAGDEEVLALAFVFRNEDGSKIGKASGDQDIFYFFGEKPSFEVRNPETLEVSLTPHPDWAKDATIYEVNVRQYTQEGTFQAFAQHLPRLRDMGVDILWFMPIQPIGVKERKGTLGSYYAIRNYTETNPEFGTLEDFKQLVDQCHDLGFSVVLDWVANHTARDHHWIAEHPDWYNYDNDGSITAPGGWADVADLNYDNPDMRRAMIEAMRFWIVQADIDGFRCDVAGMVPADFWNAARKELEAVKPLWMLAEDESQTWLMNEAFNANYGSSFHHAMNKVAKGELTAEGMYGYFEKIDRTYPEGAYPMQFITNHDENSWNGTVFERLGDGHQAFATLSFTVPGMPLIYSGQEANNKKRLEFFEKDPIDWSDTTLLAFYTQLNELKAENPALWNGTAGGPIEAVANDNPHHVVSFSRQKDGNEVFVVINLSDTMQWATLQKESPPAIYREHFSGERFTLEYGARIALRPWDYLVFIFEKNNPLPKRQLKSIEQEGSGLKINTTDGVIYLRPHSGSALEVEYVAEGATNPPSYALADSAGNVNSTLREFDRYFQYVTDAMLVRIDKEPLRISYSYKGKPLIAEEAGFFDFGYQKGFRFDLSKGEMLMGGGMRVLGMDRRGERLRLYNKPSYGYETHADLMYYSMPVVLSSKKYMLVFDNGADGYMDLGATESDILQFEAVGGRSSYLIVAADEWDDLAANYTELTGRQPMPPRWALGNIASRMGYHSQREVEAVVDKYFEDDIPLDVAVLDIYWFGPTLKGHLGNLEWYRDSFPEPEKMLANFEEKGVKMVMVTEPFVIRNTLKYQEVIDQNLAATDASGEPYHFDFYFGNTTLLDIFKPETRDWFWSVYKKHTLSGVDGWWGDLGEPEVHPDDIVHVNGLGREVHNLYGHVWAQTLFEGFAKDFPDRRPVILMRAGFAGSQRYGLIPWSGDVNRTWGGLKPQVEIALSMGLQGLAYMHSDLGGFAGDYKDAELYTRWLQYGVFQPVYRTHAQEEVPAEPIFWDDATKAIARRYIKLRYQLMPYLYTMAYENATEGLPLMRPLFYVDDNPALLENTSTYLWGENMLISPVTSKGAASQKVQLPNTGRWFNFWTDEAYEGNQEIEVPVDINDIPVFVKAGAFIPMVPAVQSTKDYSSSKLILHYFHDETVKNSQDYMYEDDGETKAAYAKGEYELVKFNASYDKKLRIAIQSEGDYPGKPATREVALVVHNVQKEPKRIIANLKSSKWDSEKKTLTLRLTLEEGAVVLITLN
jgi:oligosaccharide 4-alpha-D-glucosyltransferase